MLSLVALAGMVLMLNGSARAFQPPKVAPLTTFDQRETRAIKTSVSAEQAKAVGELRRSVGRVQVDFDPIVASPKLISSTEGFLTGPDGEGKAVSRATASAVGKNDPYRATKAFLTEHWPLFGHGPEALEQARIKREFTTSHNGLKSVVWEQHVDGVALFESVLIAHTTSKGELVNISSQFVPSPGDAADRGTPQRAALMAAPTITAAQAVKLAAANLSNRTEDEPVTPTTAVGASPDKPQKFKAPFLRGESEVKLIWVPMDKDNLRLCWDVILSVRQRGEMYRVLVDAQNGQVIIRRCLTEYISDASYRVFTSDSPSPFSPGHPTPLTNQPPLLARTLVTLPALDTNASPAGWIDDGGNETLGNNVDAHTDFDDNDAPDLPRPAGWPFRVFDFPMDAATQQPGAYRDASVVQLFYWCNWMHDKLYELGFTAAAGNFQSNNFGRGGIGGDAVQADAQDGGDTDNANFSTPPDGLPGRMQMYLFTGPSPDRDSSFDAEIVPHEYTHGLSNRRVGGGAGLSALQSQGMGEGWSDWYGLTLLSESGDALNGTYAAAGYSTYQFGQPSFRQNYYYGIRRYPYSTDMTKNPLTFKDIDPAQISSHPDVPKSPLAGGSAKEVHNQGEFWCVTLWEARANLIAKHGFATGNQLILQLVTDGMNLSPANPTFVQARDAILLADGVDTGGANRNELWSAFAKRGLGANATCPISATTAGVVESFDRPDNLLALPPASLFSFFAKGPVGGPFSPALSALTLTNAGGGALAWALGHTSAWLNVSLTGGTLAPGGPSATVVVSVNSVADTLPFGIYRDTLRFTNLTSGVAFSRPLTLRAASGPFFDDFEPDIDPMQWDAFSDTVLAANYASAISGFNALWFGGNGLRFAETRALDTTPGGVVGFYLRLANDVDLRHEPVVLEYSTNDGAAWIEFSRYDSTNYRAWTRTEADVPNVAQSASTKFRWRQEAELGSCCGHWALDDVGLDTSPRAPVIRQQPADRVVALGPSAQLTVAAGGSLPLSFQWRKDGADIAGATNATYTILHCQSNHSGSYGVRIANPYGFAMSSNFLLTVIDAGNFFDSFDPGIHLVQWSGFSPTVLATNYGGSVSGANALWFGGNDRSRFAETRSLDTSLGGVLDFYLHFASGVSQTWENVGLPGDGVVLEYSVDAGANWIEFGRYDDDRYRNWTRLVVDIPAAARTAGTRFRWRQLDYTDAPYDHWALDEVGFFSGPRPPQILTQPASQVVGVGQSAQLSVSASGVEPFTYQWFHDGMQIAGATSATYTIFNVQSNHAGRYNVTVANANESGYSSNATLTVLPASSVVAVHDDPAYVNTMDGLPGPSAGTVKASIRSVGLPLATFTDFLAVTGAYQRILIPAQRYRALGTNLPAEARAALADFVARGGALIIIGDYSGRAASLLNLVFGFSLAETNRSGVHKRSVDALGTEFADDPATIENNVLSTVMLMDTLPPGAASIYTNTFGGSVVVIEQGSGQIVFLGWDWYAPAPLGYQDGGWLKVLESALRQGPLPPRPPSIFSHPKNLIVHPGSNAIFRVTAFGSLPMTYQWRRNGTNLFESDHFNGVAGPTLTVSNADEGDVAGYSVVISNQFGVVTSFKATLSIDAHTYFSWSPIASTQGVNAPFPISIQARNALGQIESNFTGRTVALRAALSDGTPVAFSRDESDAFVNGVFSAGGQLSAPATNVVLIATDSDGFMGQSNPFDVVFHAPAISGQPVSQTVRVGDTVAFRVTLNADPAVPYVTMQWRRDGVNLSDGGRISGATGSTLTISNAIEADAGRYSVVLSSLISNVTSAEATLTFYGLDHFAVSEIIAPQITNKPFAVSIQARDALDRDLTSIATASLVRTIQVNAASAPSSPEKIFRVVTPPAPSP